MQKKNFVDNLDLPVDYNHTNLTLIPRDPYWVFAYWEISPSVLETLKKKTGNKLPKISSYIIRMHDITSVDFNGKNANSSFDINIAPHKGSSYINLPCDNVNYCAELGITEPDGKFFPLTMSNYAAAPRLSSSPRSDLIWMDSKNRKRQPFVDPKEEEKNKISNIKFEDLPKKAKRMFLTEDDIRAYYSRIMSLYTRKNKKPAHMPEKVSAGKYNKSLKNNCAANNKDLNDIILSEGFNNNFSGSSGMGSSELKGGASEREEKGRKFFFEIGTELIVFGRTEPDAEVLMNGKKIDLRNDGTFSMRFAFPDGKIPLDFIATSNDKVDRRTIMTSAERAKTRSS
ncbi:MAG: DUF4912 domain-containing protein [bacterium]|nr:DUF4912 domain-containing protein [bacterium]